MKDSMRHLVVMNLRGELARRGYSQAQAAHAARIGSQAASSRFNERSSFTLDELDGIARMLDMSLQQLLLLITHPIDSIKQIKA